jgi:signal transduction histidine kinase
MFSKPLSRLYKTFGFRLTVSFSLAFILVSALLFGFAYFLVSSSLQANDRTAIQLKLKEYSDEYRAGSTGAVQKKIETESASGALRWFMVRVADAQNKTVAFKSPGNEANYDFRRLESMAPDPAGWIHLKATGEDDVLDIAGVRFPDGSSLQIGKGPEEREDILDQFLNNFVEVLAAIVLISVVAGVLLSRQALRPVRNLTSVLGPIIDTGKIKSRVPVSRTGDDFEELAVRFNQALERIDTLVEGMRASMDNVAHDLRTPMTRLRSVAELALQSEPSVDSYREALSDCLEESDQVLRMLNMLMDISEVESGSVKLQVEDVNLSELTTAITELYRGVAEDRGIRLAASCPADLCIAGDRNRLLQMMGNLLDNALKYTPANGRVEIVAALRDAAIAIEVRDSGVGIPSGDLHRIWERSFRGDKSRSQRGLGLGLSLVKAVVQRHGGTIDVTSEPGKGTTFSVQLPTRPATEARAAETPANLSKV